MKRIIEHKSNREHYKADACLVWCFDDRFSQLLDQLVLRHQFAKVDLVRVAGGAKGLASPSDVFEQRYLLDQISKSIALHHAPKVILMAHSECGAYGKKFATREDEESYYRKELDAARNVVVSFLADKRPEVDVLKYFADFDGILES